MTFIISFIGWLAIIIFGIYLLAQIWMTLYIEVGFGGSLSAPSKIICIIKFSIACLCFAIAFVYSPFKIIIN